MIIKHKYERQKCEVIIKAILATIKYKLEILRLKMGEYDITKDCKIQYLCEGEQRQIV